MALPSYAIDCWALHPSVTGPELHPLFLQLGRIKALGCEAIILACDNSKVDPMTKVWPMHTIIWMPKAGSYSRPLLDKIIPICP